MIPVLAHPERVASASIRGYLYQTVGIALQWLALSGDELLLCEGDQDAERYIFDKDGAVRDVTQVQFKDIADTLSVRNEEVSDTIFNFLCAFARHDAAGHTIRFVFTTSARRARQQVTTDGGSARHSVALDLDVLKRWASLAADSDRDATETKLVTSLRELIKTAKPLPASDGKVTKAERDHAELETAVTYIDGAPARWKVFLGAVEWQFDQGSVAERLAELETGLGADSRTLGLPASVLAHRLVLKVLETSAQSDLALRTLDRTGIDAVAALSAKELEAWSATTRAIHFQAWMVDFEARLDELDERTAEHARRLDRQDGQLIGLRMEAREKLKRASTRDLAYLRTFQGLQLGSVTVQIDREVVRAIAGTVVAQSLLVVGNPGSGKSGALAEVAAVLEGNGHDVVVLTASSAAEMGNELVDALQTWAGTRPGILIVDSLDSIRDDTEAEALRKTLGDIERLKGRWHIAATIRTFDLYQGTKIARLFAGKPQTAFVDARFPFVRHVCVGDLTEDEVQQLETLAKPLFETVRNAPPALASLLRVPFYLMLTAVLLDGGTSAHDIASVCTRVDLLDLYWDYRVADLAASRGPREALLRETCDRMIKRRSLQCTSDGLEPTRLYELRTADVLRGYPSAVGQDDDRVVFSHHVLFDYAVARVWLPGNASGLADRIAVDSQLLIVARPSLEMALQRWWAQDETRAAFWTNILILCGHDGVRDIGKLIGPGIAAAEARTRADILPLAEALAAGASETNRAADAALGHLVGALIPRPRSGRPIAGADAGPWAELAEAAATTGRASPMENARRLLGSLTEQPQNLSTMQLAAAGRAARALFAAGAAAEGGAGWLLVDAVAFVCRTQRSDAEATAALIRTIFVPQMLEEMGFVLVPRVAREIIHLFNDPELVEAIYVSAFGRREESRDETSFGGLVFGLRSNRRQDYEGGLFSLREAYPAFLEAAPTIATRALVAVLQAYAEREHPVPSDPELEGTFEYQNNQVRIRADYSCVWDGREHEDELVMADAWENFVHRLAGDQSGEALLRLLFATCVEHARIAIVWSRWLHAAQRAAPSVLGSVILPLLESPYVLWSEDTTFRAGECLKSVVRTLETADRVAVERAILGTSALERQEEARDESLARLLGCAGGAALISEEGRAAWNTFQARGLGVDNRPRYRQPRFKQGPKRDTDDWLRMQGAPIDVEPDLSVRAAARALADRRAASDAPWSTLLDDAENIVELVMEPEPQGLHPSVVDDAWGEVSKTLEYVSALEDAADDRITRDRISQLALIVAQCPCPRSKLGADRSFHDHPSYGSPHARGDAAGVLAWLARRDGDADVLNRLAELAVDDVPSVRFRVMVALSQLVQTQSAFLWHVADRAVVEERARAVVVVVLGRALAALADDAPDRVVRRVGRLLVRVVEGPGADEVRRLAYQLIGDLWLEEDNRVAAAFILECVHRPESDDVETLLQGLRPLLVLGDTDRPDQARDAVRRRAQSLLHLIVREATQSLGALRSLAVDDALLSRQREIGGTLVKAAREIFFASGAHDAKAEKDPPPLAVSSRFFAENAATMAILAETGIPQVVHSLIETLEFLLPHDPRRAFELIAMSVASGRNSNYQYDSMAVDVVVRAVRRFLAEHRGLLQSDASLRDLLLDVLDAFVQAGWPQAQEVTYGLEEVFR